MSDAAWLRIPAALLLAAIALVGALGCGEDDVPEGPAPVDVDQLLREAADRLESARSFHFTLEHENGTSTIVRGLKMAAAEGDVMAADRMQLRVEAQAGPFQIAVEMIILPDESWMTNPLTGRWEREEIDVSAFFDPANGVTALMRQVTGATIVGVEEINSVQCHRVEAVVDSSLLSVFGDPEPGRKLPLAAWIGVDSRLVQRIEVTGGVLPDDPEDLIRRLTFSGFGSTFDIRAPR